MTTQRSVTNIVERLVEEVIRLPETEAYLKTQVGSRLPRIHIIADAIRFMLPELFLGLERIATVCAFERALPLPSSNPLPEF